MTKGVIHIGNLGEITATITLLFTVDMAQATELPRTQWIRLKKQIEAEMKMQFLWTQWTIFFFFFFSTISYICLAWMMIVPMRKPCEKPTTEVQPSTHLNARKDTSTQSREQGRAGDE